MSADEQMKTAPATAGRKVAFVGGPEAGRARIIPESHGDLIKAGTGEGGGEYIYRIWPFQMAGHPKPIYFAFTANEHPLKLLFKMWEEYSIAAQIRGGDFTHIQRIGKDIKTR